MLSSVTLCAGTSERVRLYGLYQHNLAFEPSGSQALDKAALEDQEQHNDR
jgi:hypothetical protein